MHRFIDDRIKVKTMLLMLQNEMDIASKTMYLDVMEGRVCFQQDIVNKFGDTITQYQASHQYVTEKQQVEVVKLDFLQTLES